MPAMANTPHHFVIEVAATDLASICKFAVGIVLLVMLFALTNYLHGWSLNAEPKHRSTLHRAFLTSTRYRLTLLLSRHATESS